MGSIGPMTVIAMSRTEIDRMSVLQDLAANRIKATEAATLMSLGRRQVFRLAKAYAQRGPEALVSRRRGRPGLHRRAAKEARHVPFGQGAAATWPEESYAQGRIDGTPGRRVARSGNFTRRSLERQVSTPTHRKAAILLPPSDISNWRKS